MKTAAILLLLLAGSAVAEAQCSTCGRFHGGAPSSSEVRKSAQQSERKSQELYDRYREQAAASERAYQEAAGARIAEIREAEAKRLGTSPERVPDPVRERTLQALSENAANRAILESAGAAMAKAEAAPKDPKRPPPPETSVLLGAEASRMRVKLAETLKELDVREAAEKKVEDVKQRVQEAYEKLRKPVDDLKRDLRELLMQDEEEKK